VYFLYIALTIIDVILALGIIAAVLLQSGKSAGLSGSIAGGAEMLFGGKKKGLDELLAKVTKWVAVAFLVVTIILAFFER
jgi:preprotein translocase subunit SecG